MDNLLAFSYMTTVAGGLALWFLEGAVPFFTGRKFRGKHAAVNLSIAAINLLILLPSGVVMALCLEQSKAFWSGVKALELPFLLETALVILLIDLWMYLWHRLNHRIDFLWRFHSIHHSDPALDVTTAWRFHYVEIVLSELLRFLVFVFIGAEIQDLLLYSMLMTPIIEFHHSNVSIPSAADRVLRLVIPSPLMHRIHHSVVRSEHDSNYGSMLSLWDRLFGSFKLKKDIQTMAIGLSNESAPEQQRLSALLKRPFHG